MAEQRKYRLTPKANWFIKNDQFRFRVAYDKNYGEKPFHLVAKGPVVTIPKLGVVTTTNAITQGALVKMIAPQKVKSQGQLPPAGLLFEDITGSPIPVDVDLDTILT